MTRIPEPGPAARQHGPYDTEREAAQAARALGGPLRDGRSILSAEQNRQLLTQICDSSGVTLGTYDQRIIGWIADFGDSTCAAIAGLIARAHGAGKQQAARSNRYPRLSGAEARMVRVALDDAAEWARTRAGSCFECQASPADLCDTCAWRLQAADEYDALAEKLRSQP